MLGKAYSHGLRAYFLGLTASWRDTYDPLKWREALESKDFPYT
jgi:hypothetical protein